MVVSTHWWLIPSSVVLEKAKSEKLIPVIVISSPPVVEPFDGETIQPDVLDDFEPLKDILFELKGEKFSFESNTILASGLMNSIKKRRCALRISVPKGGLL